MADKMELTGSIKQNTYAENKLLKEKTQKKAKPYKD